MTTHQEIDAEIKRLQDLKETLPIERSPNLGWADNRYELARFDRRGELLQSVCYANADGLNIVDDALPALDGIKHDHAGCIRVVGYVNVQELKAGLSGIRCRNCYTNGISKYLLLLIDRLEKCEETT